MHSLGDLMVLHHSTSHGSTIAPPRQSPAAALLPVDHRQDPHRLKITILDYSSVVDLIISKLNVTYLDFLFTADHLGLCWGASAIWAEIQTASRAARNVLHMFYCLQDLSKITCLVGLPSPICPCHTLFPYLGIPESLSNRADLIAVQIPWFDRCKKRPSSKDLICDIWCVPNKNWSSFKIDLHCLCCKKPSNEHRSLATLITNMRWISS